MFLPQFDLPAFIQSYNQNDHKNYQLDENFGCEYLSSELLLYCKKAIDAINDSSNLFLLLPKEIDLLKQRRQKLSDWRLQTKSESGSVKKIFDRFKQAYVVPPEIVVRKKFYDWRKQQYQKFNEVADWINFVSQSVPLEQLEQLKLIWQQQSPFALHNPRTLVTIAYDWLPKLITYHRNALRNLKWHYFSMPQQIYDAYKNYLEDFLKQAQTLKLKIASTMLYRLQVFSDTHFCHADPIVHMAEQLNIKHPAANESLTGEQFLQFYRYVTRYGSTESKSQLQKLSWIKHKNSLTLATKASNKHIILVPKALAQDIPERRRNPKWLFTNANLRYELCEKHALDFVLLQQLPDIQEFNIENIANLNFTLAVLKEKQELVNKLKAEINQPSFNKFSIIHWRMLRFVKNYKQLLEEVECNIIEAQLSLAEVVASKLLEAKDNLVAIQQLPQQYSDNLRALLRELQSATTNHANRDLIARFKRLQVNCVPMLAWNHMLRLLHSVEQGVIIEEIELNYLKTVLLHTNVSTHPAWQQFSNKISKVILQKLLQELKRDPYLILVGQDQNEHYLLMRQYCEVLNISAPQYDSHVISEPLIKYFLKYLNVILRCQLDEILFNLNSSVLEIFEKVISLFPKTSKIFVGEISLSAALIQLQDLRSKKNWYELQVEAESLACMLGEKFLVKHVNNSCEKLDSQIKHLVRENGAYTVANEAAADIIFKARNHLTASGKQKLDDIVIHDLKTHEQVLVGLKQCLDDDSGRHKLIPKLVELSSQARQLQIDINSKELTYAEKSSKVLSYQEFLDTEIENIQQNERLSKEFSTVRALNVTFFKPYVVAVDQAINNLISNIKINSGAY